MQNNANRNKTEQFGKIPLEPGMVYSEKEACIILLLSSRTLRKYRQQGLIKKSGLGRKICYTYENIMAYLTAEKPPAFIKRILDMNGNSE